MKNFHESLTAWKFAVVGERKGTWPTEMVAASLAEYATWEGHLGSAKVAANQAGIACQFNRSGKGRNMAAWIIANDHAFKITFKQPEKKGVAETSIEKYHSIDTRGQTLQVAMAAASLTQKHGYTTDSQVAEFVGIPSARVSARRNEIEGPAGVVLAGVPHYFETAGRVVCPVTGSSVNGWRVVASGQGSMF